MSTPELWEQFPRDPRQQEYAELRASDADRDLVLRALGEAFADGRLDRDELDERSAAVHGAKTLGELPRQVADLVPVSGPAAPHTGALSPAEVERRAVERWQRRRREALMGFLGPTLVCWVVWAVIMFGEFPWPLFPMIGTAIPLLSTFVQKQDMIAANRKSIVEKQAKELSTRREPPPEPA